MELYRKLAKDFISKRREYSHVRFEKIVSTRFKNEILVMSYLEKHAGAAHPKELSEEFMISTAQMAVILNHLEEKGYVIRLHDPQSHRQTIVRLTEQGAEFFDRVNHEVIDFMARLFCRIGEEDSAGFVRIIYKLMDAVAEESLPEEMPHKTDHPERKTHTRNPRLPQEEAIQEGGNE